MSEESRKNAQIAVCSYLEAFLATKPSCVIGGYSATDNEIDIFPVLKAFSVRGYTCALPRAMPSNRVLTFQEWMPGDRLELHPFLSIYEPSKEAKIVVPDILLVPFVVADKRGYRLGFGKGFYDATLRHYRQHHQNINAIGVGYEWQLVENLPCDPHDEPLDSVITNHALLFMVKDKQ